MISFRISRPSLSPAPQKQSAAMGTTDTGRISRPRAKKQNSASGLSAACAVFFHSPSPGGAPWNCSVRCASQRT